MTNDDFKREREFQISEEDIEHFKRGRELERLEAKFI